MSEENKQKVRRMIGEAFGQGKTELVDDLHDPVIAEIAEIVHDADLMDEKYGLAPSPRAWTRSSAVCN